MKTDDPLWYLYKRQSAPKKKTDGTKPRGRPTEWDLPQHRTLVYRIDEIKAQLRTRSSERVTDKAAIEAFVNIVNLDWSASRRRDEIEFLRKTLPTSRKKVRNI